MYHFTFTSSPSTSPLTLIGERVISSIWHARLGHPSSQVFLNLVNRVGLLLHGPVGQSHMCHVCTLGKSSQLPFQIRNFHSKQPLDSLHLDVWGPFPITSVSGYHIYLSIVDDFSCFVWLFLLTYKSDVFSVFSSFKTQIEN